MSSAAAHPRPARDRAFYWWCLRVGWRIRGPFSAVYHRWKYRGVPAALRKACEDPFDYALGLRNGRIIFFSEARLCRPFVYLSGIRRTTIRHLEGVEQGAGHSGDFDRGLDVRLDDISWVADAPHGS